jgi:hypothetical protein
MLFTKKAFNRKIALEKITEALTDCETSGDYNYILGLLDMAWELNCITLNERADYNTIACKRMETAKKAKREKEIRLAEERKAKAKKAKESAQ